MRQRPCFCSGRLSHADYCFKCQVTCRECAEQVCAYRAYICRKCGVSTCNACSNRIRDKDENPCCKTCHVYLQPVISDGGIEDDSGFIVDAEEEDDEEEDWEYEENEGELEEEDDMSCDEWRG